MKDTPGRQVLPALLIISEGHLALTDASRLKSVIRQSEQVDRKARRLNVSTLLAPSPKQAIIYLSWHPEAV